MPLPEKTITLSGFERPVQFRDTLKSLVTNDLDGWHVSVRIEPSEKARLFVGLTHGILANVSHSVVVNDRRLGITDNPFRNIDDAFASGSRLNLCLEEDLLVSPDATALALWYERHHRPHWLCLSLLAGPCGTTGMLSNPALPETLFEGRTFNSLGFAVRREEWSSHIREAWLTPHEPGFTGHAQWRTGMGWDWAIYALIGAHLTLRTVQPVFARATHTGRTGIYSRAGFHDQAFTKLKISDRTDITYVLKDAASLPHEVSSHLALFDEAFSARSQLERLDRRRQRHRPTVLVERLVEALRRRRRPPSTDRSKA